MTWWNNFIERIGNSISNGWQIIENNLPRIVDKILNITEQITKWIKKD